MPRPLVVASRSSSLERDLCSPQARASSALQPEHRTARRTSVRSESDDDDCVPHEHDQEEVPSEEEEEGGPPESEAPGVRLLMFEFRQNDPKADTGMKLCRLKVAKSIPPGTPFHGIVLSSETSRKVSAEDREALVKFGLAGINCSWNRLEEVFGPSKGCSKTASGSTSRKGAVAGGKGRGKAAMKTKNPNLLGKRHLHRTLPFLLAANPTNYGKAYKLSTAEAMAAALILGAEDWAGAELVLSKFKWGPHWFDLNREILSRYGGRCGTSQEVEEAEAEILAERGEEERRKEERKNSSKRTLRGSGLEIHGADADGAGGRGSCTSTSGGYEDCYAGLGEGSSEELSSSEDATCGDEEEGESSGEEAEDGEAGE